MRTLIVLLLAWCAIAGLLAWPIGSFCGLSDTDTADRQHAKDAPC
jgi:hypothetical protein